ncbi:MAG: hypothetical protein SFV52_12480 [Saprospiraceae bacterium]|nr:hypothetical protein [Saprospiraceae bacterium]
MKTARLTLYALLFASLAWTACNDDDEREPLNIPSAYDGANFNANTATEAGVRQSLTNLVNEAKKGRTAGVQVPFANLNQLYNQAGNPTLVSITTPYYAGRLNGASGFLQELANASGTAYVPGPPTGQGGVFADYLFDENGLEMEQMIEKGLFAAMLYKHFNELTHSTITDATVDRMLSIFGAHPDFPNSYQASKHANPDVFSANYAARRDKNDGNGFYTRIRDQFIKLQAAVRAGSDYNRERDEAIEEIRSLLEKSSAATVINYCYATISRLSATNPTDADKGAALHAYGEAVGFMHGWRTAEHKTITDAQIDEVLILLNAPYNGTPTSYTFVTDPVNQLPKLTEVINRLADIYDFSATELEDFKQNWVTVQNR